MKFAATDVRRTELLNITRLRRGIFLQLLLQLRTIRPEEVLDSGFGLLMLPGRLQRIERLEILSTCALQIWNGQLGQRVLMGKSDAFPFPLSRRRRHGAVGLRLLLLFPILRSITRGRSRWILRRQLQFRGHNGLSTCCRHIQDAHCKTRVRHWSSHKQPPDIKRKGRQERSG